MIEIGPLHVAAVFWAIFGLGMAVYYLRKD